MIEKSLKRDCIELYVPLEAVNNMLDIDLEEMPNNKIDFFNLTTIEGVRNEDMVKDKLSKNIDKFLTADNPLVIEIEKIINHT